MHSLIWHWRGENTNKLRIRQLTWSIGSKIYINDIIAVKCRDVYHCPSLFPFLYKPWGSQPCYFPPLSLLWFSQQHNIIRRHFNCHNPIQNSSGVEESTGETKHDGVLRHTTDCSPLQKNIWQSKSERAATVISRSKVAGKAVDMLYLSNVHDVSSEDRNICCMHYDVHALGCELMMTWTAAAAPYTAVQVAMTNSISICIKCERTEHLVFLLHSTCLMFHLFSCFAGGRHMTANLVICFGTMCLFKFCDPQKLLLSRSCWFPLQYQATRFHCFFGFWHSIAHHSTPSTCISQRFAVFPDSLVWGIA